MNGPERGVWMPGVGSLIASLPQLRDWPGARERQLRHRPQSLATPLEGVERTQVNGPPPRDRGNHGATSDHEGSTTPVAQATDLASA
jgi:hypothetical protein